MDYEELFDIEWVEYVLWTLHNEDFGQPSIEYDQDGEPIVSQVIGHDKEGNEVWL